MSVFSESQLAYRRDEDRARDGIPITIACPAVALLFVSLRIYTRAFLVRKLFWEDYAIVAAMALSIFLSVFLAIAFTNGAGRHFETVSPEEFARIRRFAPVVYAAYISVHATLKLSIVLQYIRISVMPFEKRLCYGIGALLVGGWISFSVVSMAYCVPFYAIWTPNVPGAVCVNTMAYFTASQLFVIIMDFVILIVPLFILRHLSIPMLQRLVLGLILALGTMASVVSILRLQVLYKSTTSTDKTWDSVPSGLYSVVELNIGIACACVVTLRPLFGGWWWKSNRPKPADELRVVAAGGEPHHRRKPWHHRQDEITASTESTQVLSASRSSVHQQDVELGAVYSGSYAGSTMAGSAAGESKSIGDSSQARINTTATASSEPQTLPSPVQPAGR